MPHLKFSGAAALAFLTAGAYAAYAAPPPAAPAAPAMGAVLAASAPGDWRPVDPARTLYVDLPAGRVVIELEPRFAPLHVAAIERLARAGYYDGLPILRVQDNYVVQWADPEHRHPLPDGPLRVAPEFDSVLSPSLPFTRLPDGDVYAPEAGFSDGVPVGRSVRERRVWLAHCYGMVGVGRDLDAASGSGAALSVVIGHAPRHLDRNVALVGRVLEGMELLAGLPRGAGQMGFYTPEQQPLRIERIRVAADLPAAERTPLEQLRTDTPTFAALVESRRNRPEEFFKRRAGKIDLCNVPLPVRAAPARHSP